MDIFETLPYLKSFTLVVELQSFAQAAKKLHLATPTVSKQINRLEEILGVALLVRTTRTMRLTEAGSSFYEQAKRILEEVEQAEEIITGMQKEPAGRLNVVAARYFAKEYIVPHVKSFLQKYPAIFLNLELAERVPDIEKEGIDLLIGMSVPIEAPNVIQKRIMWTRYAYTAAPSYVKKWGNPKKPQDLASHRYLAHSMRRPSSLLHFQDQEAVQVTPYLQVNDAETLLELAIEGLGIVKTHEYVVAEALKKRQLLELFHNHSSEKIPIYLAYPERRIPAKKTRLFIDFILSHLPANQTW